MKNNIKCTNCASTDLELKVYYTEQQLEAGSFSLQGVNTYVCKKCGHVEFFDASLDSYAKELKGIKCLEEEKKRNKLKQDILVVEEEIKKLNRIIDDLDSTQRQVIDAKEKLPILQDKLNSLKAELDSNC